MEQVDKTHQSKKPPSPDSYEPTVSVTDYRFLFASAPDPYLVLDPKLIIVAVNDAYLIATMTKREEILGRDIFEVFPDNPAEANATGARNLRASLERVLANRVVDTMAVQKYDIRKPKDVGGDFEERYWCIVNTPVNGVDDKIAYIIHRVVDTTDFIHLKQNGIKEYKFNEALRESAVHMDAEIYARSQEIAAANLEFKLANEELAAQREKLRESEQRFASFMFHMPSAAWIKDLQGRYVYANAEAERIFSIPFSKFAGKTDEEFLPLDTAQQFIENDRRALTRAGCLQTIECLRQADGIEHHFIVSKFTVPGSDYLPAYVAGMAFDITELKRAEEALRESENRYRTLFNAIDEGFCIIEMIFDENEKPIDYRFLEINPAFEKQTGLVGAQGKRMRELAPKHEEHWFETYGRIALTGRPARFHNHAAQLHRWYDVYAFRFGQPENRQVAILFNDITERKQTNEALKAANSKLKELAENLTSTYQALDSIGLIVCTLDENDCRIKIFNSGAENLLGYRKNEAIGKSIGLIYQRQFSDIIPGQVNELRQGNALQSFNISLVRKSGEQFSAVLSIHPFDYHEGHFRKAVGVFRDISDLMLVQEQLKAANDDLERKIEQRTRELQETQKQYLHAEKLSAIGKLSASIAHEFNNPLQGILSVLKVLKKRAILEEEDKELLDSAIDEGNRIKDLIRGLREFNRPSLGKEMAMDVHKTLDSILLLHKSDFNKKLISVVCNYAEELPQILAIPDQIKQVFLNLLINAADACHEPGGKITVTTWQENDKVAVAIKDTGVGIKPEEMEHIFRPFFTTKAEVKGTGLGLSVSYGIVKKHHGEIRVDSQPDGGATFTVLLPIQGLKDTIFTIDK